MAKPSLSVGAVNIACFRTPDMDKHHHLLFQIWYLANELKAIGGTNYTLNLDWPVPPGNPVPSLLNDVKQMPIFGDNASTIDFATGSGIYDAVETAIYYNNAANAGATVSNVPTTVMSSVNGLMELSNEVLLQMKLWLIWNLGYHKTLSTQ